MRHADFVAYWKAISIAFTGAFGILGLLTEFRNKHTKQITIWGWISLFGILVSTICGVAAQVKESHDDAKISAENSTRALSILQNTSDTVTSINKMMSSLVGATVDVTYSLNCAFKKVSPCGGSVVQEESLLAKSGLTFYFFAEPAVAKHFTDGAWLTTYPDLQWAVWQKDHAEQNGSFGEGGDSDGSRFVVIPDYTTKLDSIHSSTDRITSLLDLSGATLVILGDANQLNDAPVLDVTIKIKDGRSRKAGPFDRLLIHPTGPYAEPPPPVVAYRYVFSK